MRVIAHSITQGATRRNISANDGAHADVIGGVPPPAPPFREGRKIEERRPGDSPGTPAGDCAPAPPLLLGGKQESRQVTLPSHRQGSSPASPSSVARRTKLKAPQAFTCRGPMHPLCQRSCRRPYFGAFDPNLDLRRRTTKATIRAKIRP